VNKVICEKIVQYLLTKEDHMENLDSLLIALYDDEIKQISDEILNSIKYLISQGVLEEFNTSGDLKFRLNTGSFLFDDSTQ
jgi:hypothetical protein